MCDVIVEEPLDEQLHGTTATLGRLAMGTEGEVFLLASLLCLPDELIVVGRSKIV